MFKSILSLLFLTLMAGSVHAAAVALPQTGIAACWNASGASIACAGTGQDGDTRTGVAWPSPRFTDNGDGSVTDNLTRLVWLKDTRCTDTIAGIFRKNALGQPLTTGLFTWSDALTWSRNMKSGDCGLSDGSVAGQWRLPNMAELKGVTDISQNSTMLAQGYPFTNLVSQVFWTSTSYAPNPTLNAFTVSTLAILGDNIGTKTSYSNAWPVRDAATITGAPVRLPRTGQTTSYGTGDDGNLSNGVAWPTPRFTDNANGTVTDNLTGLIWLKNAKCTETVNGISNTTGSLDWGTAFPWVGGLKNGSCGLSDGSSAGQWRVPNINELRSLVDYSRGDFNVFPFLPVLPVGHPFTNAQGAGYMSSSTDSSTPTKMWLVNFATGQPLSGGKAAGANNTSLVWPVRSPVPPVNGACGSDNGSTLTASPASVLCTQGSATAVTGTGPWGWTCAGANGGVSATCFAKKDGTTYKTGDCDANGTVTIAEVQSAINMFLSLKPAAVCVDMDGANGVSIAEVQQAINRFLGL